MVEQSVPADSVSALRESALAAAGVRGIFTNLIDGKSVGARNTLDVLDPATGELLAKVIDETLLHRTAGLDARSCVKRAACLVAFPVLVPLWAPRQRPDWGDLDA